MLNRTSLTPKGGTQLWVVEITPMLECPGVN
jgi:hypothetical protein